MRMNLNPNLNARNLSNDYQPSNENSSEQSNNFFNKQYSDKKKCQQTCRKTNSFNQNEINYVNLNEEDQMKIFGYRKYVPCVIATFLLYILTLGIVRLLFYWKPQWMLKFTHIRCSIENATKVLLVDHYNQIFVEDVYRIYSNQNKKETFLNNYSTFKKNDSLSENDENCLNFYNSKNNKYNKNYKNFLQVKYDLIKPKKKGEFELVEKLIYFMNKKLKYIWDEEINQFLKVKGIDNYTPCSYFYSYNGLSIKEQEKRRFLFGPNEINVEVQSVLQILFNEILGPFYVFQIFSIIIWSCDNYFYYASCIVIMSTLSLALSVRQIRKNQKQLRDTVRGIDNVTVCLDDNNFIDVDSTKLVPGDIIVIPAHGCLMQCDAVLISGNVIVNESMLTGESIPVTKTPISTQHDNFYDFKEHSKHTLYGGTNIIQTRFYNGAHVKAMVIRTGFLTSKGELVRSIIFPKPVDFQFNRHIYRFIHCLALLAIMGSTYTVILKLIRNVAAKKIILGALDLVTIIIPPALPAAMTVGVVYAQSRLKKEQIFCISPRSINISGCLNCICFDKTGTLTEDHLSFSQVLPVNLSKVEYEEPITNPSEINPNDKLLGCLTTCHSLTLIDGNIIGDPLDQKMFEVTNWHLEEPEINDTNKFDLLAPTIVKPKNNNEDNIEIGILRQFQFSSSLQRMSVISRKLNENNYVVFSKGAPEMIFSLCDVATLPNDVHERLHDYTEKGYRVLALATRELNLSYVKMQKISRVEVENNLTFLGLLVMGNMLKPETKKVINVLKHANIRCIMVTGDNMLTALSVSRECDMISFSDQVVLLEIDEKNSVPGQHRLKWKFADKPEKIENDSNKKNKTKKSKEIQNNLILQDEINKNENFNVLIENKLHIAITGKTFAIIKEEFSEKFLQQVAIRGTVFARMSPEQKQQLIELLQSVGYYVGMCGDGANDCGALKAAHAGVSLSETEASVASPFTSKQSNISCIPQLIREGRASLVTAFGILKYMACYSLTQFFSVIILYTFYSNLTDMEFLYIDLFLISIFVIFFGRTKAYPLLAKKPPPSSLIGLVPLLSITLQLFFIFGFQIASIFIIKAQSWYESKDTNEDDITSHDNYSIFAISVFQYISSAVIFSKGAPYRKSIYTNYLFLLSVLVMTLSTIYIVTIPHKMVENLFELDLSKIPLNFRFSFVLLAFVNFILAFISESFIVDYIVFHKLKSTKWYKKLENKVLYKEIDLKTRNNIDWIKNSIDSSNGIVNKAFKNLTTNENLMENLDKNIYDVNTNSNVSLVSNNNSTINLISRGYESDQNKNLKKLNSSNQIVDNLFLNTLTKNQNSQQLDSIISISFSSPPDISCRKIDQSGPKCNVLKT